MDILFLQVSLESCQCFFIFGFTFISPQECGITAASEPLTTDFFLPQLQASIALKEDSMNAYLYASEDSETLEVNYSTFEKLLCLS